MDITNDDEAIRRLLAPPRRIAMVGASDKSHRPSHDVFLAMRAAGHDVLPVTPTTDHVAGIPTVPDLEAAAAHWEGPIDIVDVFRRPEHVPGVVAASIAVGARSVWFQLGVIHNEGIQTALEAGLDVVVDRCIKVEQARLV